MNKIHNEYEITPDTMALISIAHVDYATLVRERHQTLYVKMTPFQIIKAACLEGGSTYEGRRKAVTYLTGAIQKVPIPINPRRNIFAFPTHSPTSFECSWIFYHHIKSIVPSHQTSNRTQSIIQFKNQSELPMNESHYLLEKQYTRTAICVLQYVP